MLIRSRYLQVAIAGLALAGIGFPASGQGRVPRVELSDSGDLGGAPQMPPLAGGVWGKEPLVLGVEQDLDRQVLYRLPWLARQFGAPPREEEDGAEVPELADALEGLPASGSEIAQTGGRPGGTPPAGLGLPEIVPFPPLPTRVAEMALAGSGRDGVLAWAALEGPPEAPAWRLGLRRFAADGTPYGPDHTLQVGPGRPADVSLAMAPDGTALAAWTSHLPGRGASLHWRSIGPEGDVGPLRREWDIASDQGSPSAVALPGGFGLAFVKTVLEGPQTAAASQSEGSPKRELLWLRLNARDAAARGDATTVAAHPGLDHPSALGPGSLAHVFWTDRRAGGRMLHTRSIGPDGVAAGPETPLRTDLRPADPTPYRVVPASDGLWLVVWTQLEGRGRAMVLQGRLHHASGNAAGPPLLVARSAGALTLLDVLAERGGTRWLALWTEEEAGRFRLRYRPMRIQGAG